MRALLLALCLLSPLLLLPAADAGCTTTYYGATSTNAGTFEGTEVGFLVALAGNPLLLILLAPTTKDAALAFEGAQGGDTIAYAGCVI